MGDDARLAGAGAGENQQRAFGLQNGFLLFGIEAERRSKPLSYRRRASPDAVTRDRYFRP